MKWIEPDWPAPANVHAATTLRTGGVSKGNFASLNPATHVNDCSVCVQENRRRIKHILQLPAEPVWLNQLHGTQIIDVDQCVSTTPSADAGFSRQAGSVCAVLTADCLPILLCDNEGTEIAAVHAGWRGLLAGIIEQSVQAMSGRRLIAWLGPAIGPLRFEVGEEVRQAFVAKSQEFADAFRQHTDNNWLANIYRLARITLRQQGIADIYGGNFCTVTDAERFFSYRRDGETGRMATLIWRD